MLNENEERNKILNSIAQKKNEIESYLKTFDKYIYDAETKYLESTQNLGNVLKGWDQIFSTKPRSIPQTLNPTKKTKFSNNERLFSQTSFNNNQLRDDYSSQSKILLI
jgi:chromatin modification-related protein EAF6